jgi:hypothetical protein
MDEMKYTLLDEVIGRWKADVIENFLKSEGIEVVLIEPTVSDLFTPTFAPVKIYVQKVAVERARKLLGQFNETQQES